MNVLSLFDGMSCGQIALERSGFKVDNYFAAEIDKHAIQVAKTNYPNTQHLGDVTKVKAAARAKVLALRVNSLILTIRVALYFSSSCACWMRRSLNISYWKM